MIIQVAQYGGDSNVRIAATQLEDPYTATQARKIVDEWVEFLSAGPTPIRRLRFLTRTPKRLFAALTGQTQLEELHLKWGDYDDLTPIAGMAELRKLTLGGASAVRSIQPLTALQNLTELEIDNLQHVHDLAPLASLAALTSLDIGGNWTSRKNLHLDSLAFLRSMPQLQRLIVHTTVVDDHDYSPLLALPALTRVRVMASRGMTPAIDTLRAALPWE